MEKSIDENEMPKNDVKRRPPFGIGPDVGQEANVENGGNRDDHEDDDQKENRTEKAGKVFPEKHDRFHHCENRGLTTVQTKTKQ